MDSEKETASHNDGAKNEKKNAGTQDTLLHAAKPH